MRQKVVKECSEKTINSSQIRITKMSRGYIVQVFVYDNISQELRVTISVPLHKHHTNNKQRNQSRKQHNKDKTA